MTTTELIVRMCNLANAIIATAASILVGVIILETDSILMNSWGLPLFLFNIVGFVLGGWSVYMSFQMFSTHTDD